MPVWGLAKKSVRVFLNFSFGQFFSQPLSDEQVVVTEKGVGCKDIYFNIKKINAILAERGIPFVLCVAYISEVLIRLPWSIELNGVDFVLQAAPDKCRPVEDDSLLNSMISSMTAAAFAAAKVADDSHGWFRAQGTGSSASDEEEDELDAEEADSEDMVSEENTRKSSGLISRVQRFFERLTQTAEKTSFEANKDDSVVDQDSKERVIYMIDSLIAQTTVILRNVSLRVECQLGFPGLNRASGITLYFQYLSIANQSSTDSNPTGGQRHESDSRDVHEKSGSHSEHVNTTGDGWSWLWPWGYKRQESSHAASTMRTQSTSLAGSLSTMLHKIIRLEGADVLWDLWDCSPKLNSSRDGREARQRNQSNLDDECSQESDGESTAARSTPTTHHSEDDEEVAPIPCPTKENMVASAKLFTLAGAEHTARVSLRCPLFALSARSDLVDPAKTNFGSCSKPSDLSAGSWSSFELRAHLDVGPVVACVCPSQLYWLQLIMGQLNHIWQVYQDNSLARSSSLSRQTTPPTLGYTVGASCLRGATVANDTTRFSTTHQMLPYEECAPQDDSASELVDLDLSTTNETPVSESRTFIDSKLFWSCMTDVPEEPYNGEDDCSQPGSTIHSGSNTHSDLIPVADPKFVLAANVLCCALVVFYEDEPVSTIRKCKPSSNSSLTTTINSSGSFGRSVMLQSTLIESVRPGAGSSINSENNDRKESGIVNMERSATGANVSPAPSTVGPVSSATPEKLTTLPGPYEFFARFHGLKPWRQPQLGGHGTPTGSFKRSRSTATLYRTTSFAELTGPMRIDRSEVDTGQMTPTLWVAYLRRQFAELASPRDHICFVGGLWHFEVCARAHNSPPKRGFASSHSSCGRSSTEFSAQLFGLELSECLFPDPPTTETVIEPSIYDIISFPDRLRGSNDRIGRIVSDQTALKLSGTISHTIISDPSARDRQPPNHASSLVTSEWERNGHQMRTVLTSLVELACCRIDVDISLTDRMHRITDALAAASEAVNKFTMWTMSCSARSSPDWDSTTHGTREVNHFSDSFDAMDTHFRSKRQAISTFEADVGPTTEAFPNPSSGSCCGNSTDIKLTCVGCEILIRFPIPLEAIKMNGSEKLSDLRKRLWSSGVPLWSCPAELSPIELDTRSPEKPSVHNRNVGLAWWRRSLRPEHLRIGLDKLVFNYRTGRQAEQSTDRIGAASTTRNHMPMSTRSKLNPLPMRNAPKTDEQSKPDTLDSDMEQQHIQLSLRSIVVHWFHDRSKVQSAPIIHLSAANQMPTELIMLAIRLAKPGRTDLVEQPCDPRVPLDEPGLSQPVYAYSHQQRFEMGVDLANSTNTGTGTSAVEWSLWRRTGPKQDLRTPFVIRRDFLQDAPKMHSKQTTYYPGDVNHLNVYRQSASLHTRLHVHCTVPVFLFQVENKRAMELTYTRLMYDLLLWNSLLPSDRRLRATLTRRTRIEPDATDAKLDEYDHCYWFLSDPAPLASIYAHPEAAREAAAREAISSTGLQKAYGLHFHPLYSDDDYESSDEAELEDEALYDFDAGLDAIRDGSRSTGRPVVRVSSVGLRAKSSRSRTRARTQSSSSDDRGPVTEGSTTIQRQSQCTVQLRVNTMDARFTVPDQNPTGKSDLVRVVGSDGIVFAEIGHDGASNLNYFTTELNKLELLYSPAIGSVETITSGEPVGECTSLWWPCVLGVSWQSIGYPVNQTLSCPGSEPGMHTSNGPMLALAIRHRQTQRPHPTSDVPVYRDEITIALRLKDTCLAHWPQLEAISEPGSTASLPHWLSRLLLLLETPSVSVVSTLWPGYQLTDALLVQHIHLERLLFTWSSSDIDPGSSNHCPYIIPSLRSARALIGCESISVTVNTASEAPITTSMTHNSVDAPYLVNTPTVTPSPGMLIMSFVSNAAMFIYPILRSVPPGLEHLPSAAAASATTNSPSGFMKWLTSLKMTDSVCVADLDHVELRCFTDPMRNPASDPSKPNFLTRVDVRSTNNLLRLHTCVDSLAALQILIQTLTAPEPYVFSSNTTVKARTNSGGTNPSGTRAESPVYPAVKTASGFGSRTSLHSNSPRHVAQRIPTSGSTSSVEDLLQGAISDVDSPQASPHKPDSYHPHHKSKEEEWVMGSTTTAATSRLASHRSPEPRPCRTKRSSQPNSPSLYPRLDADTPPQPIRTPSPCTQHSPPSSDSSPNDFILVKPSMVPARPSNPLLSREQIRCLINTSGYNAPEPQSTGDVIPSSRSSCGFDVRENHYPAPNGLSAAAASCNRMHRLFTDPPSVYPRANMALTLYNFSMEWNIHGGFDLVQPVFTGTAVDQFRASPHPSQAPTPEHKLTRPSSGGSGSSPTVLPESRLARGGGTTEVSSGAAKIGGLQPGVRFRHDRPLSALPNSPSVGSSTTTVGRGRSASPIPVRIADASVLTILPQELYVRGGRCRDASKCISIRLNKLYFRHSTFPEQGKILRHTKQSSSLMDRSVTGDPASRYVFNCSSLIVLDRVQTSRINQLLYTFTPSATPGSTVPHSADTPMLRAAVVCWRVPAEREYSSGPIAADTSNSQQHNADLELEAKISIQPLRINIDQNTLHFIEEFQQQFANFALVPPEAAVSSRGTGMSVPPQPIPDRASPRGYPSPVQDNSDAPELSSHASEIGSQSYLSPPCVSDDASYGDAPQLGVGRPSLFIRKVTFYPDLLIRLDYHGRHLDLGAGSLHGFLRMLIQLNNGELVIPRRVYQRGYPNVERLLEEVMNDLRVTIASQLPQLIATSLGPMHEVRLFLMGLWDLIYQPVHSVYRGQHCFGRMREAQWPATEWELSNNPDPPAASANMRGNASGFIQGLRRGTRSFSTSTLWATLQLSIQSVRAVQSIAETAYDLVTPGPALRSRQLRLRQPADLREGFGNAMNAMTRGFQMVTEDLCGATRLQSEVNLGYKGPVGMVGDVLRQIPPTIVAPVVAGCEIAANILGGFRNQLRPEAKIEDEQKWKDTHGL